MTINFHAKQQRILSGRNYKQNVLAKQNDVIKSKGWTGTTVCQYKKNQTNEQTKNIKMSNFNQS